MKITKAQLRKLIKEELDTTMEEEMGQQVYILAEPSTTYGGENVEIKLLGVFLGESEARSALEQAKGSGSSATVFAVPVGKVDLTGYTD
jgi:hypothetical protein